MRVPDTCCIVVSDEKNLLQEHAYLICSLEKSGWFLLCQVRIESNRDVEEVCIDMLRHKKCFECRDKVGPFSLLLIFRFGGGKLEKLHFGG